MFGLVEGSAKDRTVARLVQLLEASGYHLTTGFVGTPYLNLVLADAGHYEAAYKLLLQMDYPSWLYQITQGATTIWEHWDGIKEDGSFWSKEMNSFNHYAYGAVGDFLYRHVAGIEQTEEGPGYKQFLIQPHPGGGLTSAAASLESMYGTIRSEWTIDSGTIGLIAVIPPNTSATVLLPDALLAEVSETGMAAGQPLEQVPGIHSAEQLAQVVKVTLGSGNTDSSTLCGSKWRVDGLFQPLIMLRCRALGSTGLCFFAARGLDVGEKPNTMRRGGRKRAV